MRIAICGGTGFVGKHLVPYLIDRGHEITLISRSSASTNGAICTVTWNELKSTPELLEGVEAIVNLAGESINQRWTQTAKQRILDSRLSTTRQIAQLVEELKSKPSVVVNASGISIYGTSETDTYDERSPGRLTDFLAHVVEQWELAADQIQHTRVVKVRVGIVLGSDGGAFPKMALPYKLGVGGKVGSGKQWLSWIHMEDMVRLIDACLHNDDLAGPVNATAPSPVTNAQFGHLLARALNRPSWFPVPAVMMKLIFGELAVLLLEGQKVLPRVLLEHGFSFKYPQLEDALADLVSK